MKVDERSCSSEECNVCYQKYKGNKDNNRNKVRCTQNKHGICEECHNKLQTNTCPTCRGPMPDQVGRNSPAPSSENSSSEEAIQAAQDPDTMADHINEWEEALQALSPIENIFDEPGIDEYYDDDQTGLRWVKGYDGRFWSFDEERPGEVSDTQGNLYLNPYNTTINMVQRVENDGDERDPRNHHDFPYAIKKSRKTFVKWVISRDGSLIYITRNNRGFFEEESNFKPVPNFTSNRIRSRSRDRSPSPSPSRSGSSSRSESPSQSPPRRSRSPSPSPPRRSRSRSQDSLPRRSRSRSRDSPPRNRSRSRSRDRRRGGFKKTRKLRF